MPRSFKLWKQQPASEQLLPLIEQWFQGERGQRLLNAEQALVKEPLSHCFGYHLLQVSVDRSRSLSESCSTPFKFSCHPQASTRYRSDIHCEFDQLPIATDSIDTVILHHAHEYVANPHAVLREIQRVLVPRGQLIVIGFNPWSLFGLYRMIMRLRPNSVWRNHAVTSRRVVDWLSLLEFRINSVRYGLPGLPLRASQWLRPYADSWLAKCWHRSPFGAFYVISATKDVSTLTPIKPSWTHAVKAFSGLSPASPTRNHHKESS